MHADSGNVDVDGYLDPVDPCPRLSAVTAYDLNAYGLDAYDLGLLILRLVLGLTMAAHGYNKFFGAGGLTGTAG